MKRFVIVCSILLIMSGCTLRGFAPDQQDPTDTPTHQSESQSSEPNASQPSATPEPTFTPEPTATPSKTPLPEGHVIIPDVVGWNREDAYQVMEELGLVPKTFWVIPITGYEYKDVTGTEPDIGKVVKEGSVIILNVVGVVKECK